MTDKDWKNVRAAFFIFIRKFFLDLFILFTTPLVFLFIPKSWDRMPKWLRYYEDFNYGINGDPYWKAIEHANGKEREYKWRVLWSWRNANTYDHEVNGFKTNLISTLGYVGDVKVSDNPGHEGLLKMFVNLKNGQQKFSYYYVKKSKLFKGKCLRCYIGWKLKDSLDDLLENGALGDKEGLRPTTQFVFVVNPFMSYTEN